MPHAGLDTDELVRLLDAPGVRAIVLLGSWARGDAGTYSDIDVLRLVTDDAKDLPGAGSRMWNARLLNVGNVPPTGADDWFGRPDLALDAVLGLRAARALLDRDGAWAGVRSRADEFRWDGAMQRKADALASERLIGWIEEAFKGLEGLRRDDVGRLLSARHGLTWGLSGVMRLHRGVLVASDNDVPTAVAEIVGGEWARLQRRAFAVEALPLREQVLAGLRLYILTARELDDFLQPEHQPLVRSAVAAIEAELRNGG